MRRTICFAVSLVAMASAALAASAGAQTTTLELDADSPGRTFDGVGSLSAGASSRLLINYPERERSEILDYLFKPGYGAAQQILKVEIGGDTNSTDGTEPSHMHSPDDLGCGRGYEWWLMEEAKRRNPDIILAALAWGAPGWVGRGLQTVWTDEFVDYLLSWLDCAGRHGLQIDYLGGWNEKGFDAAWYGQLRRALDANGYGSVKVVADDSFNWTVVGSLASDPEFAAAVDVVGQHYVCGYLGAYESCPSPQAAQDLGMPLWASEQGSQPHDSGAAPLARAINRQYVDGRMTGTINWSTVWSAYAGLPFEGDGLLLANEPWSGHYVVGPSIWAVAHTTQFTRVGWRYLDGGSQRIDGGSVVSLRAPEGGDWTSVAETLDATAPQEMSFTVRGGLSSETVRVWATRLSSQDPRDWFVRLPDVQPRDGRFTATLQPGYVYSFTTTGGQGKGAATSPPRAAWRLPYLDDFDAYRADATPRYVSDLGGSFATAPCHGRSGMCLRSVVDRQPVRWNNLHDRPITIVGDPADWHNYQVAVDARLDRAGSVDLGGRVINGTSGYRLRVGSDGHWTLSKVSADGSTTTLADGGVAFGAGSWHRLALTMRTLEVTASIDGEPLATVSDQTHDTGQVSLAATDWQNVEFDNLAVTPAPDRAARLSLSDVASVYVPEPGNSAQVAAEVENPGPTPATAVAVDLRGPEGWTVTGSATGPDRIAAGERGRWSWQVLAPAGAAPGRYRGTVTLRYRSGGQSGTVTRDVPILLGVIPHEGMTATTDSTQGAYFDWCCYPHFAIDDDPATMWHSQWSPFEPLPHEISLDLGGAYNVTGLLYQPRNDNNHNGIITSYAVWVSADGNSFERVAEGDWSNDFTQKSARFPGRTVRHVRLQSLAGSGGYASAAELDVYGTPAE
jgi:hypothetical protein